jgi:predicted anti-sigma-YlaC factor YlaD
MNCKSVKELLFTDHLDGRLVGQEKERLIEHLKKCAECRRLEQEIREKAVLPFSDPVKHEVPETVWRNIKERIIAGQDKRLSLLDLLREKLRVFSFPRPAFSFASTMIVLLVAFGLMSKSSVEKDQSRDYFAQQMSFYAQLDQEQDYQSDNPFEEYIF